jgi:hypothetical protein
MLFSSALLKRSILRDGASAAHAKDMNAWFDNATRVFSKSKIGCLDGVLVIHRDEESTKLDEIELEGAHILRKYSFDPNKHIKLNKQGIYTFRKTKHKSAKKISKKLRRLRRNGSFHSPTDVTLALKIPSR